MESKDRQQLLKAFFMFGVSFATLIFIALLIFGGFTALVSKAL